MKLLRHHRGSSTATLLAEKAITYLKRHPQNLPSLTPHFTPEAASHLLLSSHLNQPAALLNFLNWAQPHAFFTPHCKSLALHLLTRFHLFKTAQSLAEDLAGTLNDTTGAVVFHLLNDSYHKCRSSSAVFDLVIKSYSRINLVDRALHTVDLALRHGFSPGVLSYNSILDSILRHRASISDAERVFRDMVRNGVSPNVYTYNVMIRGFAAAGKLELGFGLMREMEAKGCSPNVVTYNTLIAASCKEKKVGEAFGLLRAMAEKGVEPNLRSFNAVINGFCAEGKMREAHEVVEEMNRKGLAPDCVTYNTLVNGFCKEGNFHQGLVLLHEMAGKGLSPNVVTYTTLISGMCKVKNLNRAVELLFQMRVRGLSPNERTYTTLIDGFCQQGLMNEAYKVLSEMIVNGFSPSVVTYNALVHGYCFLGRVEEAVGILRGMAERGLSPDVVSYTTIISGFCVFDQEVEKALEMKVEMVEKGILPNAATFSMLIRALCREGRLPEAFDLFREMLCGGFSPDKCTYLMLINAYCAEGEFSKVFHLNDEMIHKGISSNFVTGFSPSLVTYNALIHGCCVLRRVEDALGILRGMAELGLSPDAVGYNTVISGFCKIGEPGKAYKLMLEMVGKNIQWLDEDTYESLMEDLSDEDTYSSLMNEYLAEGNLEMAFEFDREVSKNGYLPSHVTYSARLNGLIKKARTTEAKMHLLCMIYNQCLTMPSYITYDTLIENCSNNEFKSVVGLVKGFIKRGLLNEAARAHDTMLHGNYKPDGAVYNLLIFSHSRSLNVDKAYNMYKEMVHYGFDPHMFSVLALIKALYHVRRYDETRWVIQNTLRSCNLNDSELPKVLDEIDVRKFQIHALLSVLAEIAVDGLLLDGGKCSYASASSHRFSPTTIIVFLIFIIKGLVELSLG